MHAKVSLMNPVRYSILKTGAVRVSCFAVLLAVSGLLAAQDANLPPASGNSSLAAAPASPCDPATLGSPFIPVDSWIYPAVWRLYALGYTDHVFLGVRPWTRASLAHMLDQAGERLDNADAQTDATADEARGIYDALNQELRLDLEGPCGAHHGSARIESAYSAMRGLSGTPLHDSFHLGSTIVNDYGRPYENGFNK